MEKISNYKLSISNLIMRHVSNLRCYEFGYADSNEVGLHLGAVIRVGSTCGEDSPAAGGGGGGVMVAGEHVVVPRLGDADALSFVLEHRQQEGDEPHEHQL